MGEVYYSGNVCGNTETEERWLLFYATGTV